MSPFTPRRRSILSRLEQAGLHPFSTATVPQGALATPRQHYASALSASSPDRSVIVVKEMKRKVG
jgi:hypothetical protein